MSWAGLHISRSLMGHGFIPKGSRAPHASLRNWWEKSVFVEGEVTETISPYRLQHLPSMFENMQQRILEPLKEVSWVIPVFVPLYYIQSISMHALEEKYHHDGDPFLMDKE